MNVNKYNYMVVLFKDKEKRKIINKFLTDKRALLYYDKLIKESDDVLFEMRYENGFECKYELGLIQYGTNKNQSFFVRDEYGRQIKVELEDQDHTILKISNYRIEEYIHDYQTKKKITTKEIIKKYLPKVGFKLISKLNNKIVIQNDDDFKLFTLKNSEDSDRFLETLTEYFKKEKRIDCILVKDTSTVQRKYLYDILITKGFQRSYLFRQSTTHPVRK
jgi:hypothetical protein